MAPYDTTYTTWPILGGSGSHHGHPSGVQPVAGSPTILHIPTVGRPANYRGSPASVAPQGDYVSRLAAISWQGWRQAGLFHHQMAAHYSPSLSRHNSEYHPIAWEHGVSGWSGVMDHQLGVTTGHCVTPSPWTPVGPVWNYSQLRGLVETERCDFPVVLVKW